MRFHDCRRRPIGTLLVCGALASVGLLCAVPAPAATVTTTMPSRTFADPVAGHRSGTVELPPGHVTVLDARTVRNPMPHVLFGTIVRLSGTMVVLRTRTGSVRAIDAQPAFAAGTISLPLFVGKYVAVDGIVAADGTMTAARITRMTRLTPANRDR